MREMGMREGTKEEERLQSAKRPFLISETVGVRATAT